jgi:hypothetical protein
MQKFLHAVDDHRPVRLLGDFDDTLHPQKLFAMHRAEQFQKSVDSRIGNGAVMHERKRSDAFVMMAMAMMTVAAVFMVVMAIMLCRFAEPAARRLSWLPDPTSRCRRDCPARLPPCWRRGCALSD